MLDQARLQATLGDPRLARVVAALRGRLQHGEPLAGTVTLTRASDSERAAIDELLGRPPTSGASLSLDLGELANCLHDAGIADDLTAAVEGLGGPVTNVAAERARDAAEWDAVFNGAPDSVRAPGLDGWLDELRSTGTLKRLSRSSPGVAKELLARVGRVLDLLPARGDPLAAFAATTLGNAHALDPGLPVATLAVRAAARLGGIAFEKDDAETRRNAWAAVGVMCDELSTPALVLNLPASADTPLGRLLRAARDAGEPLHVSLRLLLRYPLAADAAMAGGNVFICENPTIVALAATRIGRDCAPLVCVNGQFATPSLILLRQLRAAGACLHYHGDFDPAGLTIARRVFAEGAARPWRFGAADYAAAPKGERFSGTPGATPWDPVLQSEMHRARTSVHEEAVFELLQQDLAPAVQR